MIEALQLVSTLLQYLRDQRSTAEDNFTEIWNNAQELAVLADVELKLPRLAGRQQHRQNVPTSNVEQYFRQTVYITFLDSMIQQLTTRFEGHNKGVYHISSVIPAFIANRTFDDLLPAVQTYSGFLSDVAVVGLPGEFEMWKAKWSTPHQVAEGRNRPAPPATALDSLKCCHKSFFPNVHTLLLLSATLPVTTSSVERSFSSLKRVKSYLRSTMSSNRLNGLALPNVHHDIPVDADAVIDDFARHRKRKLEFVL